LLQLGAVVLLGHVKVRGEIRWGNGSSEDVGFHHFSVNVRIILKWIWKEYGRRECRLELYVDRDLLRDFVYAVLNSRVWEKVGKPFFVVKPSSASV